LLVSETDPGRPSAGRMLSPRMERVRSVSFLMPSFRETRPDLGRGGIVKYVTASFPLQDPGGQGGFPRSKRLTMAFGSTLASLPELRPSSGRAGSQQAAPRGARSVTAWSPSAPAQQAQETEATSRQLSTSRNPVIRPPGDRQSLFVEQDFGESSGSAADAARRAGHQWPDKLGPCM